MELLLRFVDGDAFGDVDEGINPALVTVQPRAAEHVHGGDARHGGSGGGEAIRIRTGLTKSGSKKTQVHGISGHASIHPGSGLRSGEDADAAGNFAEADKSNQTVITPHSNEPSDSSRREHRGQTESNAEPTQASSEALLI